MAVQASHLSHAFRLADDVAAAGGPVFMDEFTRCGVPVAAAGVIAGDTTMLRDLPRSDLTCNNYYEFEPTTKRARVVPAASTSGRWSAASAAGVSGGLLLPSRMYSHDDAEIDALIRLETERMRAGLEDARRRHARALLAAAGSAASGRLHAAEAELERALRRNAELEDRARQAAAECQAWAGVARSHEAVSAGLRATLDQLLLQSSSSPCAAVGEGDAEDAQSCCFEAQADGDGDGAASRSTRASSCRACGGGEACVLLLPCRHLCLCKACEAAVDACPVCAAAKNGSLIVRFS
ncbi:hypothetical protein QOZ80_4AG0319050 [Eleusine coracana subsp. coracana]|nr:hypothetical protein QOZ80_4AG0319050 [Eleusine coracana subsp. coracana]